MPNKSKGTGVAQYIEQNLNAVVNYEASVTTVNLETLFLTIAGKRGTVSVGVLYRPTTKWRHQSCNGSFMDKLNVLSIIKYSTIAPNKVLKAGNLMH